jgi:hypothetical protein
MCFPICASKFQPRGTYNKQVYVLKGLRKLFAKIFRILVVWKVKMKRGVKAAVLMVFLLGSVSAMADTKLTAEECNDYPFKPVVGEITHAQLMQELAELESVGYDPHRIDYYYPNNLQAAQGRLHAKYVADCAPAMGRGS